MDKGSDVSSQEVAKVNDQHGVAVARGYDWFKIDKATPRGAKLQLLTRHGVAVYGQLSAGNIKDFLAWAPCPDVPDWLKRLLSPSPGR